MLKPQNLSVPVCLRQGDSLSESLPENKYKTGVGDLSTMTSWGQEGRDDEASMRQSLAQKCPGYTSHGKPTTFVLMETKRQMLGAPDPQGPREPWEGLEGLLHCLLSLSFWSSLLTLADASLDHFSKEVWNRHWLSQPCCQWHAGGQPVLFQLFLASHSTGTPHGDQTEKDKIPRCLNPFRASILPPIMYGDDCGPHSLPQTSQR